MNLIYNIIFSGNIAGDDQVSGPGIYEYRMVSFYLITFFLAFGSLIIYFKTKKIYIKYISIFICIITSMIYIIGTISFL